MAEYIRREDYCEENCGKENREGYKTCTNCGMLNVPSADVQPANPWLKTSENLDKLEDHYYYLVTHPAYKTPIKAKYHDDMGGYFEFPHYPVVSEFTDQILGECKIKYFMELPEMPDDYEEVDSVD